MTASTGRLLMGLIAVVVIIILGLAAYFLVKTGISAVVGLPMLAIAAVITLLALLCGMSVIYATFDLQDKTQALALPEGSIRAVIALMLIVLFAVLSIYLYGSISDGNMIALGKMDEAGKTQLENIYSKTGFIATANPDKTYQVWVREGPSAESVDFAKQLLVLVGTLVTSISSFYFGSKVASQSSDSTAREATTPVVGDISPASYVRGSGKIPFTVPGQNLEGTTSVRAVLGNQDIVATNVQTQKDRVTFDLDIPSLAPAGTWKILLAHKNLGETALRTGLTVT